LIDCWQAHKEVLALKDKNYENKKILEKEEKNAVTFILILIPFLTYLNLYFHQ